MTQILSISCGLHHKTPRLCLANIRQHHFLGEDLILREGSWFSHQPTCLVFPLTHFLIGLLHCHFARGNILNISDQRANVPFDCNSSKLGSVCDSTIFDISERLKRFAIFFFLSPTLQFKLKEGKPASPQNAAAAAAGPPSCSSAHSRPSCPPGDNCGVSAPCVDDDLRASRGDVPALQHRPAPPHLPLLAPLHHVHVQHLLPQPPSPLGLLSIVSPLPPPLPGTGPASQEGTS